ncbi:type II toxin-antitoxin system antitoxin SocA domain-containing protein [Sphingopyxis sp. Geo48]|uniref:Panacea domain-containing protein n=1 Tax=Sphingopyxis sp. Geo48 TaxID=545241 RepID=UPI0024B76AD7|nr:type II toxin-antitoxin system antitoxin SocA domain-containing protein [Sphingopyxis sp. Geo48]
MAKKPIDPKIAAELSRLALMPDDEIDTSDAPEVTDWNRAIRGRFSTVSLDERGYDVRAIANWILDYLSEMRINASNMSLNKLIYFIFERGLVERHILYTPARVEAWNHGPVFREVYHAVKDNDDKPISDRISRYSVRDREMVEAREQFSADDMDFFKSVIDDYKDFTAAELRRISHRDDGPWDRVWKSAAPVNPGMVISIELILASAPERRDLDGRY